MDHIVLKITLPEKVSLNSIYAGMHWARRKELADVFHSEFKDKKNFIVEKFPVSIVYEFHFPKNALDTLNCAYMAKMLEDGMVHAGILKDDTPEYVSGSTLISTKSKEYLSPTVIIKITQN